MPFQAQESRLLESLRKFFGITGHVGAQLLDDMLPVTDLFNMPADMRFNADENRWLMSSQQVAVAGQVNNVFFLNPAGSNHVCIIEVIGLSSPPSPNKISMMMVAQASVTGAVSAGTNIQPLDSRQFNVAQALPQLFADANGLAVGGTPYLISGAANTNNVIRLDMVLLPGFALRIAAPAVNLQLDLWAYTRDRPLSGQSA